MKKVHFPFLLTQSNFLFRFCKQFLVILGVSVSFFSPIFGKEKDLSSQNVEQLIFVTAKRGESVGKLFFYEEKEGDWVGIFLEIPVFLGKNGLIPAERKKEGDGSTPEGSYPIQRIFGAENREVKSLQFTKLTKSSYWNHSPKSKHYNQYRTIKETKSVKLLDFDIYNLFIVIEYNTNPNLPNRGSMIFIHPWEKKNPTSGCIGLPKEQLIAIINKLDGKKNPTLFIVEEGNSNPMDSPIENLGY